MRCRDQHRSLEPLRGLHHVLVHVSLVRMTATSDLTPISKSCKAIPCALISGALLVIVMPHTIKHWTLPRPSEVCRSKEDKLRLFLMLQLQLIFGFWYYRTREDQNPRYPSLAHSGSRIPLCRSAYPVPGCMPAWYAAAFSPHFQISVRLVSCKRVSYLGTNASSRGSGGNALTAHVVTG